MSRRYHKRSILKNDAQLYEDLIKSRGLKSGMMMYTTPELKHPSVEEISEFNLEAHRWRVGDRFYKLANLYYDDQKLWWVIALFNKTPTEGHVKPGDLIYIPLPVDKVLRTLGF